MSFVSVLKRSNDYCVSWMFGFVYTLMCQGDSFGDSV